MSVVFLTCDVTKHGPRQVLAKYTLSSAAILTNFLLIDFFVIVRKVLDECLVFPEITIKVYVSILVLPIGALKKDSPQKSSKFINLKNHRKFRTDRHGDLGT